jgi:hypothetical protein
MFLDGKRVYLVNEDVGLQLVDVSNPSAPRVIGSYRPKAFLGPVAAAGIHAYIVEKGRLLQVLDVANPAEPRVIASYKLPRDVRGLAVADKRVYASTSNSLHILDVSDPASPKQIGVCGGLKLAGRVTVAGKHAYVAADFNGMRVIDVSNLARPKEVGSFEGPGNVTRIAVTTRYAYLADYSGGLYIVDIADPTKPRRVGRHGDFVVGDVAVAGNHVLLAAGALDVIDVSEPGRPREACSFSRKDSDTAWSVAVSGNHVYSISDAGFFVFRLTPAAASR